MSENIFVDDVMEVRIAGGAIRMDLGCLSSTGKSDDQNVALQKIGRTIVMTPEGFAKLFSAMEKVASRLVDDGLLKRKTKEK